MLDLGNNGGGGVMSSHLRNVYYHQPETVSSLDSSISMGSDVVPPTSMAVGGRRNSNPFGDFKEFVKRRRQNNGHRRNSIDEESASDEKFIPNAFPSRMDDEKLRKASVDSQFFEMDSDEEPQPVFRSQRRFSVPEKVLLSADFAILRKSQDERSRLEVVAAFDRHTDPYRHYMQSVSCYDLAPSHGSLVLIDSGLSVHKAIQALVQSGHPAAVVIGCEGVGSAMLTLTDVMRVLMLADGAQPGIADQSVASFIRQHCGRRKLISAPAHLCVWDAARQFVLNRVHRIPIFQVDEQSSTATTGQDMLFMLTLRTIFSETVAKLKETRLQLAPHIKNRTLEETRIGTWGTVITISKDARCRDAIAQFLERKISCLAVIDEMNHVLGVLSKQDIMKSLAQHHENYLAMLDLSIKEIMGQQTLLAHPTNTIWETIMLILAGDRQCIFVVDFDHRPMAAVAFVDLIEYILNCSPDVHHLHHKMNNMFNG